MTIRHLLLLWTGDHPAQCEVCKSSHLVLRRAAEGASCKVTILECLYLSTK